MQDQSEIKDIERSAKAATTAKMTIISNNNRSDVQQQRHKHKHKYIRNTNEGTSNYKKPCHTGTAQFANACFSKTVVGQHPLLDTDSQSSVTNKNPYSPL